MGMNLKSWSVDIFLFCGDTMGARSRDVVLNDFHLSWVSVMGR